MFSTLSNWLEDETFLIKSLTPTMTSISCKTAWSSLQDSILRLLLNTNEATGFSAIAASSREPAEEEDGGESDQEQDQS